MHKVHAGKYRYIINRGFTLEGVAQALGLQTGTYNVLEDKPKSPNFSFVTIDKRTGQVIKENPVTKRKIPLVNVASKKQKVDLLPENNGQPRTASAPTYVQVSNSVKVVHSSPVNTSPATVVSSSGVTTAVTPKPTIVHPASKSNKIVISPLKTVVQPRSQVVKISAVNSLSSSSRPRIAPSSVLTAPDHNQPMVINSNRASLVTPQSSLSHVTIQPASSVVPTGGVSLLPRKFETSSAKYKFKYC